MVERILKSAVFLVALSLGPKEAVVWAADTVCESTETGSTNESILLFFNQVDGTNCGAPPVGLLELRVE